MKRAIARVAACAAAALCLLPATTAWAGQSTVSLVNEKTGAPCGASATVSAWGVAGDPKTPPRVISDLTLSSSRPAYFRWWWRMTGPYNFYLEKWGNQSYTRFDVVTRQPSGYTATATAWAWVWNGRYYESCSGTVAATS